MGMLNIEADNTNFYLNIFVILCIEHILNTAVAAQCGRLTLNSLRPPVIYIFWWVAFIARGNDDNFLPGDLTEASVIFSNWRRITGITTGYCLSNTALAVAFSVTHSNLVSPLHMQSRQLAPAVAKPTTSSQHLNVILSINVTRADARCSL